MDKKNSMGPTKKTGVQLFYKKHGVSPSDIPKTSKPDVLKNLSEIRHKYSKRPTHHDSHDV